MAVTTGVVVNKMKKKQTYISVKDPGGTLAKGQDVIAGGINESVYKGKVKKVNAAKTLGTIRLRCIDEGTLVMRGDETTPGTLTITIIGGPTVPPVTATYVNDDEACDDPEALKKPGKRKKDK
jgi:hypothetical protein